MGVEAGMEVSTLRHPGAAGLHARSPLLRLQSDERLVTMLRRGNQAAFEVLVSRYHARLLSFCRHLLGSREDAEDVLQDVLAASYKAMLADERPLNVKPWLYRIARNRCLNHLRRNSAIGVDSMDVHLADHGTSTADRFHEREEFRQLVSDIGELPETQRTALILREMDALSYEQIAEAMETTVSSVKSLLVRARVSLTEAAEARLLTCDEVREELAEVAEGLRRKTSAPARRHVKSCARCGVFQKELRRTDRALAALVPLGPLALLRKVLLTHLFGHSAAGSAGGAMGAGTAGAGAGAVGAGAGAAGAGAAGAGAAGAGAAAAGAAGAAGAGAAGAAAAGGSGGFIAAGVGAVTTKAAAGLAAAALVTAGTVAVSHHSARPAHSLSVTTVINRAVSDGIAQAASTSSGIAGAVASSPTANLAAGRVSRRAKHDLRTGSAAPGTENPLQATNPVVSTPAASGTTVGSTNSVLTVRTGSTQTPAPTGASAPPPTGGVSPQAPSGSVTPTAAPTAAGAPAPLVTMAITAPGTAADATVGTSTTTPTATTHATDDSTTDATDDGTTTATVTGDTTAGDTTTTTGGDDTTTTDDGTGATTTDDTATTGDGTGATTTDDTTTAQPPADPTTPTAATNSTDSNPPTGSTDPNGTSSTSGVVTTASP